jgi:hypothetical protein
MSAFIGGVWDFFVPTHLLAIAALGLLTGQSRFPVLLVAIFAAGLLGGALAVASAMREVPSATMLLIVAAVVAALVVVGRPVPLFIAACLTGAVGLFVPINAPPHEITISSAITAQIGLAAAALVTMGVVTLIAANTTRPWQRIGVRIAGSWIAASTILVLVLRLAR